MGITVPDQELEQGPLQHEAFCQGLVGGEFGQREQTGETHAVADLPDRRPVPEVALVLETDRHVAGLAGIHDVAAVDATVVPLALHGAVEACDDENRAGRAQQTYVGHRQADALRESHAEMFVDRQMRQPGQAKIGFQQMGRREAGPSTRNMRPPWASGASR